MKRIVELAVVLILVIGGAASRADVFNVATDFSATNNPNGVWRYGYLSPGALPNPATFLLYANQGTDGGIDFVTRDANFLPPYVSHNPTAGTILYQGVAEYNAGEAGFHPGSLGEYSVYRFTTPLTETYSISATFSGIDVNQTSTDVHIFEGLTSLFDGTISGFGDTESFADIRLLTLGQTIDFIVGRNGTFNSDSTGLAAIISTPPAQVPEPSSLVLLGLTGAAAYWRWRKRGGAQPDTKEAS